MIEDLFGHNKWANLKLLEACEALTDEQLDIKIEGTYGTIRGTLWHIIGAEVSYVHRVTGEWPDVPLKREEFPGFEKLKRVAAWTSDEMLKLAREASGGKMVIERDEEEKMEAQYPLSSLLTQAINHANEHRAQIATTLSQHGIEPPNMEGWTYMVEMGQFRETVVKRDA